MAYRHELVVGYYDYDKMIKFFKKCGTVSEQGVGTVNEVRVSTTIGKNIEYEMDIALMPFGPYRFARLSSSPRFLALRTYSKTKAFSMILNQLKKFELDIGMDMKQILQLDVNRKTGTHHLLITHNIHVPFHSNTLEPLIHERVYYSPTLNMVVQKTPRFMRSTPQFTTTDGVKFYYLCQMDKHLFLFDNHGNSLDGGYLLEEGHAPSGFDFNPVHKHRFYFREEDFSHFGEGAFVKSREKVYEIAKRDEQLLYLSNGIEKHTIPIGEIQLVNRYTIDPYWCVSKTNTFGKVIALFDIGDDCEVLFLSQTKDGSPHWTRLIMPIEWLTPLSIEDYEVGEWIDDPQFVQLWQAYHDMTMVMMLMHDKEVYAKGDMKKWQERVGFLYTYEEQRENYMKNKIKALSVK